MDAMTFTPEEKEQITAKLREYMQQELSVELGRFDSEFLLDFISARIGCYYYNRGLYDAQAVLMKRMDDVTDAIYQLEQATDFVK